MIIEIPSRLIYIPEFILTYWWMWLIFMIIGYAVWGAGRAMVASSGWAVFGKYFLIISGWWVSLIFFLISGFLGFFYILNSFIK